MTRKQAIEKAWKHYYEHEKRAHEILNHLVGNWNKEHEKEWRRMARWERMIEKLEQE